jgi:hypothetical protein
MRLTGAGSRAATAFLRDSSFVVVAEDVDELRDAAAIWGREPTGERVNSRTNLPVIVVWHAM